jgi:RNA polymerase sigma factor (sigma-70 family)
MRADSSKGHNGEGDTAQLASLLAAIARQDREAFAQFYDATTDYVFGLALRITQKIEIAEEVVSDVFLQVWRQADRFDSDRGNARAWLTVLCRSRALDTIRRDNISPTSNAVPISEVPELESTEYSQDLLISVEESSAVHAALAKLDADQRQLLTLAYFRGYTHSELAQFTGMPLGTVKTQLRRTLIKLKDFIYVAENREQVQA